MAFAEGAPRVGNSELQALLELKRPYREEVTLELSGQLLYIDPVVLSLSRDSGWSSIQLGVTHDVRDPVTLVKGDGSIRTYGFSPSREPNPLFATLPLGLRPSRPFLFMDGGHLKATFEKGDSNSLTFALESTERIEMVGVSRDIDPRKYLSDLYFGEPATEEDVKARIAEQEERYFRYLDEHSRGGPKLTSQWREWGERHEFAQQKP